MSSDVWTGILILSALLSSCSVKEDRTDCPCDLSIVFRGVEDACCYEKLRFCVEEPAGTFVCEGEAAPGEFVRMRVKRSDLNVYAWMPEDCADGVEGIVIPLGEMCPRVYSGYGRIDSRKDRISDTVVLHKNFAEMKIVLVGVDFPAREGLFAEISASVCGYDRKGALVPGAFRTKLTFAESGECSFCLPRQTDDSLELKIICPGGPEFNFPLGLFLAERGYDWDREDLEDITLSLDYCSSSVSVVEGLWNKIVRLEITV